MLKINAHTINWDQLLRQVRRHIGIVVMVILSGLILFLLYQLCQLFFFNPYTLSAPTQSKAALAQSVSEVHLEEIAQWNLMGIALVERSQDQIIPTSQLQLSLVGILHADDPAFSQVIVDTDATSKVYWVGDEIQAGLKIQEILVDSVIISRDGQLEKLKLPQQEPLQFLPPP